MATAPPAHAQGDADVQFAAARRAYDAGDFERAARLFARAHELAPSANKKFNEAQSWRRAGDKPRAADAYAEAIRLGQLDAETADTCKKKLAELRADLGVLLVDAPAGTRVAVEHVDGVATQIHLAPGDHQITLTPPGGATQTRTVLVVAGQVDRVALVAGAARGPQAPPRRAQPPLPRARGTHPLWVAGWVLVGVGAAGGIAAAAVGARFWAVYGDYEESGERGFEDASLEHEARDLQTMTNVLAFASAGAAALGLVFVLTSPSADADPKRASVSIDVDAIGPAVRLRATW